MDYPDVSFVLQIGLTDRDQYIHRLGRTARAGKSGTGMLVLAPFEYDYMTRRELSDLPLEVTHFSSLPTALSPLVSLFSSVHITSAHNHFLSYLFFLTTKLI